MPAIPFLVLGGTDARHYCRADAAALPPEPVPLRDGRPEARARNRRAARAREPRGRRALLPPADRELRAGSVAFAVARERRVVGVEADQLAQLPEAEQPRRRLAARERRERVLHRAHGGGEQRQRVGGDPEAEPLRGAPAGAPGCRRPRPGWRAGEPGSPGRCAASRPRSGAPPRTRCRRRGRRTRVRARWLRRARSARARRSAPGSARPRPARARRPRRARGSAPPRARRPACRACARSAWARAGPRSSRSRSPPRRSRRPCGARSWDCRIRCPHRRSRGSRRRRRCRAPARPSRRRRSARCRAARAGTRRPRSRS